MSLRDALIRRFNLTNDAHGEVLDELASLCRLYDLTPEDLQFKWEAFVVNSNIPATPTVENVRLMKSNLQREFELKLQQEKLTGVKKEATFNLSSYVPMSIDASNNNLDDFMAKLTGNLQPSTGYSSSIPNLAGTTNSSISHKRKSQASIHFSQRKLSNTVDEQYNSHLPLRHPLPGNRQRADVNLIQNPIKEYRYMFEKIREKSEGLDDQIEYIANAIDQSYCLNGVFDNPTRSSQSPIVAVGRICCDASEGKLNEKSVLLETSRQLGMGKRVKLDLTRLDKYALFPGQIIAVEGINSAGRSFVVDKLLMPPMPAAYSTSAKNPRANGTPSAATDMILAAGPYTLDDDLSYQPLEELIKTCIKQKPDVVLLLGPFISETHPMIATGAITTSPEDIFKEEVIARLATLAKESPTTRILLVPHANDVIHEYPMFPQPPLKRSLLVDGIESLSNPASIEINGSAFTISNIDAIFSLSCEEIAKSRIKSDRLARLAQHLLQQQSLYPLFPPAIGDSIDAERMPDIQIPFAPDILIVPSQLKHFTRVIEGVMCVNPGYLSKRQSGGTYAHLAIQPLPQRSESNINDGAKLHERTRVDLIKL
ncbi:DNA-directed DNA polymerase alpha subunit pol12 [Apophysomyces ossiformis]|uniref:DNA polymerase alpha subunit B n=1 Tax=Apophysomyces ossiformis TaxID=679940 RepID=A0A8H7BXQ6_9FUNG|nr:DNA-directed DNA polymerase alpha subunit pol12 [Apophysomyces ossiformis]